MRNLQRHYKDIMGNLIENHEATVAETSALEDEMVKRVENLSFTEKKAIIKRVVTKIVTTRQEVDLWGRIPQHRKHPQAKP